MNNNNIREIGDYAAHEFDTWSPIFSFGARDQQTRLWLLQQYLNSSIINLNRDYKIKYGQQLSAAPDNVLAHKLVATIIKKDARKIVDSLAIDLPLGHYGSNAMEKIILQKIGFYIKEDDFDYQIALSELKPEQVDQDIICTEGIRLICEGPDLDYLYHLVESKIIDHMDQILALVSHEVTTIKVYPLKENYCCKEALDWIEVYTPNISAKTLHNVFMDWLLNVLLNSGDQENRLEIVITSARTEYSIDFKVNERTIPSSKFTALKFTFTNEEIKRVLEKNDWEINARFYEILLNHPAAEFPIFMFETEDEIKYQRSWCFNIKKQGIYAFQSIFSDVISAHFKTSDFGVLFLLPTDSKELGYFMELAQLKQIAEDGIIDCYPRIPLSTINNMIENKEAL